MNICAYEFGVYSFLYVIKYIIVNDYLCHLCGVILTLKSNGCDTDKTDLYVQFMTHYMTWSVYLGSVYDNPEGIEAEGQFLNEDITLYKGCVFDFLTIQWDNISLSQHDLDLWLPSSLPVSLTSKLFLRKLFDNPKTLFRIIAYNPQNGKVRPITSLYKLHPIEKVVSCEDKTHHFEIAFSDPEEIEDYP